MYELYDVTFTLTTQEFGEDVEIKFERVFYGEQLRDKLDALKELGADNITITKRKRKGDPQDD
jgi:hypothetical protein